MKGHECTVLLRQPASNARLEPGRHCAAVTLQTLHAPALRQDNDQVEENPNWSTCSVHLNCLQFGSGVGVWTRLMGELPRQPERYGECWRWSALQPQTRSCTAPRRRSRVWSGLYQAFVNS